MADIKILKANGVEVHPVTHEDAVVNNLGLSVGFTYQPKTDNSLKTSAKTVAGGINEVNSKKVINDAQNGTVDSIKIRYVKNAGARIYPLCSASKITYTNGETLQTTVNALSTKNTNVANRVSTLESTLKAIQTNNTSNNTTLNTVSTNIGTLSSLQTSAKGNLVAAVNEINQFGSNLSERLRTALSSKGLSPVSSPIEDATIEEMITLIESEDVGYKKPPAYSYTVTSVSGASYGFSYNSSNGYWESENAGVQDSYALCQVNITNPDAKQIRVYLIQETEVNYDFGYIGKPNTSLALSYSEDSSSKIFYNCKSTYHYEGDEDYITMGTAKTGWFQIKYIKDYSQSEGHDRFKFKIEFV